MYAHDNVCQTHELIYVIGHANVYLHLLSLQIESSYVENLLKQQKFILSQLAGKIKGWYHQKTLREKMFCDFSSF